MLDTFGKLQLHQVAATLTAGVVENLPDVLEEALPKDSPRLQLYTLIAWEVHRNFVHALAKAVEHDDWPSLNLQFDLTKLFGDVTDLLGSPLAQQLLPLLQGLLGKVPSTLPSAVPPLVP